MHLILMIYLLLDLCVLLHSCHPADVLDLFDSLEGLKVVLMAENVYSGVSKACEIEQPIQVPGQEVS